MNTQLEPFDWVKERHGCSIMAVFERLRLNIQTDVETRQQLRERTEFGFEYGFTFTSTVAKFSVLRRERNRSRSVTFSFRRTSIAVLDDSNQELMSATVTLADDRQCKIVIGDEILEEWQFRKKALESLFFDGFEGAL